MKAPTRSPAGEEPQAEGLQAAAEGRAGYVLIEVVAALAVTVMLMTFVYPAVPIGTTPSRLTALVRTSVALLRDARSSAIGSGTAVAATFDANRRSLAFGTQRVAIPPDVDVRIVAGGNCATAETRVTILFRPDGTNCGGLLRFAVGAQVRQVRINWIDGRFDVDGG